MVSNNNRGNTLYSVILPVLLYACVRCKIADSNYIDIIDGFGSYPHHFMSTPVFCGLGAIAFKYYMLFQHQSVPAESSEDEPSWLLGAAPGPYINERSRSIFMSLGKHVAFLGLDCRTERTVSVYLLSIACPS